MNFYVKSSFDTKKKGGPSAHDDEEEEADAFDSR